MIIELSKKFKKKLYDINQDMKTLFSKYNIYPDNIIIANTLNLASFHCGVLIDRNDFPEEFNDIIISLDSRSIYLTYSEHKSELINIYLDNGFIHIGNDENKYNIGSYYDENSINDIKFSELKEETTKLVKSFNPEMSLDEETIRKLYNGNLVKIIPKNKKYKTRLSKGVVPGLKKSGALDIEFRNHDTEDFLYFIIIRNTRTRVYTFHKRMCIVIKAKE